MTSSYKVLIFDWDGTIMDSVANICASLQSAIDELSALPKTYEEQRNVIGLGLSEAVLALYPEASPEFVDAFSEAFRDHFLFRNDTPSPLFEQVEPILADLQSDGYDMAIATGKSRRGLDKVLNESGLKDYFPVNYCAEETFSKPHPKMLEEILIDHNIKASRALMIGDTEYDMQMAVNANMHGLAATFGVHSRERLALHKPVGFVDAFSQIPEWLHNNER
ncbi:MAG: Similar to phosphoglycolate phosphatase, clustered with ribosomal large subunit pseudouridine synthase C [uncultured Thiotrichaceae bacterium]|uniref:Similar to phosphoglycolate phosphatase, clustered with ribosomal large subunit pseudouridine synthase C n=1 Tax=uncultured Thiotrichaceae bacterium TaxID=298394 RepID=A0A6S6SCL0_9GAMM|nr:MAG: Similar to phosphoglycolate phosphatase, clustered with ribosomal large subunit pseudouridine synthase C [uncultured Thiotrichaceae bacterium]